MNLRNSINGFHSRVLPVFIKKKIKAMITPYFIKKRIREWNGLPDVVLIENTNLCNAKCTMCPHSKMKRKKGIMTFDLYKHIIDECIALGVQRIQITGTGEPLLDPLVFERIRYAKQAGIKEINLFSNASLLNQQKQEALLTSGVDLVFLSVDGFTKDIYEAIRHGLSFEDVKENMLSLLKRKKAIGGNKPFIVVGGLKVNNNMLTCLKGDFYNNISKLSDFVWFSEQGDVHDWAGSVTGIGCNLSVCNNQPCRRLWSSLCILWDGKVPLCCIDYEGVINLGDIQKQSIREIWNGQKLRDFRNYHIKLKFNKIELCNNCFERPPWIPKRAERILDRFEL